MPQDLSEKIVSVAREELQDRLTKISDVCRGRHETKVGNAKAKVIEMADEHRQSIDDSEVWTHFESTKLTGTKRATRTT